MKNAILKKGQKLGKIRTGNKKNYIKVITVILNQKIYFWSSLGINGNLGTLWGSTQKVGKSIKAGANNYFPIYLGV